MAKRPPAAQTALGPMVIVAVEQCLPADQRLVDDALAVRVLPAHLRWFARAGRWPFVRRFLVDATEKKAPGIWAWMACRKRFIDEVVCGAIDRGIEAVVVLGAGLDTRAARLVTPAGVDAFEVDLPANIALKQSRLKAALGRIPERLTLVPLDFEKGDLAEALADAGLRPGRPAVFVWEGVTQYLREDGVRRTLAVLASASPGSDLVFTYVRKDFIDGEAFYGSEALRRDFVIDQRVWHFGLAPEAVRDLLAEYGWTEREQVGAAELLARYVEPRGRDLPVSEIERCVHATKE